MSMIAIFAIVVCASGLGTNSWGMKWNRNNWKNKRGVVANRNDYYVCKILSRKLESFMGSALWNYVKYECRACLSYTQKFYYILCIHTFIVILELVILLCKRRRTRRSARRKRGKITMFERNFINHWLRLFLSHVCIVILADRNKRGTRQPIKGMRDAHFIYCHCCAHSLLW